MPYGYLGQNQPNQTVNNSGVFSITDVAELQSQGKLGGSLELIEEQIITSSTASVDFTDLKNYDVHYLTYENAHTDTNPNDEINIRVSNNGGSTFISSGYQYANQIGNSSGFFAEVKSTSWDSFRQGNDTGADVNECVNGYCYLYNLLNSSKYSFTTHHNFSFDRNPYGRFGFGGAVLPTAETHNAIRVFFLNGNIVEANIKLYGVKQL